MGKEHTLKDSDFTETDCTDSSSCYKISAKSVYESGSLEGSAWSVSGGCAVDAVMELIDTMYGITYSTNSCVSIDKEVEVGDGKAKATGSLCGCDSDLCNSAFGANAIVALLVA